MDSANEFSQQILYKKRESFQVEIRESRRQQQLEKKRKMQIIKETKSYQETGKEYEK